MSVFMPVSITLLLSSCCFQTRSLTLRRDCAHNNPSTLALLKGQATGTSMASISKAVLEELEIPIPSLEKQKAIVQLTKLRDTEKKLKQRIEALREKQIQKQILNAINTNNG